MLLLQEVRARLAAGKQAERNP